MTRAEAIARLKLNREEVLQVGKKYKELSKYCQREVDALSYAIDTMEKGNNKTDKMEIIKFILVGLLGVILVLSFATYLFCVLHYSGAIS